MEKTDPIPDGQKQSPEDLVGPSDDPRTFPDDRWRLSDDKNGVLVYPTDLQNTSGDLQTTVGDLETALPRRRTIVEHTHKVKTHLIVCLENGSRLSEYRFESSDECFSSSGTLTRPSEVSH